MSTSTVVEREGLRVYKYRNQGKTFKAIGALIRKSPNAAANIYYKYAEKHDLPIVKTKYTPRQQQMVSPKHDYVEVEKKYIEADGLRCEVIREGENTYTVNTEHGTGVVLKKGLKLVGPLKVAHEVRYGRSYTGLFNNSKRGMKA